MRAAMRTPGFTALRKPPSSLGPLGSLMTPGCLLYLCKKSIHPLLTAQDESGRMMGRCLQECQHVSTKPGDAQGVHPPVIKPSNVGLDDADAGLSSGSCLHKAAGQCMLLR